MDANKIDEDKAPIIYGGIVKLLEVFPLDQQWMITSLLLARMSVLRQNYFEGQRQAESSFFKMPVAGAG